MWALLWSLLVLKIFRFMSHKPTENYMKPNRFWEFVCRKISSIKLGLSSHVKNAYSIESWLFKFGLPCGVPRDGPFVNKGRGRPVTGLVSHVPSLIKGISPPRWKVAKTKKKSLTLKVNFYWDSQCFSLPEENVCMTLKWSRGLSDGEFPPQLLWPSPALFLMMTKQVMFLPYKILIIFFMFWQMWDSFWHAWEWFWNPFCHSIAGKL